MCVIAVAEKSRPTEAQVCAMYRANDKGAGVAWRTKGAVVWAKGLTLDEAVCKAAKLPLPYVIHFRVPSQGTLPIKLLCHPFPLSEQVELDLEGTTEGRVLFHNGLWPSWKEKLLEMSVNSGGACKIPPGTWSDSRGLAWVGHHFGLGALELIFQKVVVFGPRIADIDYFGVGWHKITGDPGELWVSNMAWEHDLSRLPVHYRDFQGYKALPLAGGGAADACSFRGKEGKAGNGSAPGQHQQEAVQESHEAAGAGKQEDGAGAEDEALDAMNFIHSKNPSQTKPLICTICRRPQSVLASEDGVKWTCSNCNPTTKRISIIQRCLCGAPPAIILHGVPRCYRCYETFASGKKPTSTAVELGTYQCFMCLLKFGLRDVIFVGHDDADGGRVWECKDCYDVAPPSSFSDEEIKQIIKANRTKKASTVLPNPELEKRRQDATDGVSLVGPL